MNVLSTEETTHIIDEIEETLEEDDPTSEKTDGEEMDEEEIPASEPVRDLIVEVMQNTIDFFQFKQLRIVAIGDSLTQGVGDETEDGGYVGTIDQIIHSKNHTTDVKIENYGKRGNRTDQLMHRLEQDDELQQSVAEANIILVTIGANDIMKVFKEHILDLTIEPFEAEQIHFERRLRNILSFLSSNNENAQIYLLGIYNPFAEYFQDIEELEKIIQDWNDKSKQTVNSFERTTFIPIKDLFEQSEEHLFAEDNFHPNKKGYERMAERVLQYLTDN